jgi:hypothetical protein
MQEVLVNALGRTDMDAVQKIQICQKYKIEPNWAMEAFVTLCTREQPLTVDEGERLGTATSVLIAQAREIFREDSTTKIFTGHMGFEWPWWRDERKKKVAAIIAQTIIISRQCVFMVTGCWYLD